MYNAVVSLFQHFLLLVVMLHVSLVSIKFMCTCVCVVVEPDFTPLEPCRVVLGTLVEWHH